MATMAASATALCLALLLVALQGAHPAPVPQTTGPPSSSCTTELLRLLPCLSFLDGGAAAPPDTCCANLGSMVHDEPLCLCQALSQSGSGRSPVAVNMSRAVLLPSLCRLDLPAAASACSGLLTEGQAPSPPESMAGTNVNSTVPLTPTPMTPTPPLTTAAPTTTSQNPGYSSGSKLIADAISAALGFMALVTVLAF
ncbi:non-specific lipid-transfer protein-like protein [Hordeum vulgare]|nr:non-specific lipid-transfer protein-like protein [Hordeum vulgare]